MSTRNDPESSALSLEEITLFENARGAINMLKKTFETWVVIGRAVVAARQRADRVGGRQTFARIIEQQGLARLVDKATASRLLRIMDNLPEVEQWRQILTERQQFDWAAPTAVFKHCPLFKTPRPEGEQRRPSRSEQQQESIRTLEEKNHELEKENHRLKQREDGDRWKPTDKATEIAQVMVGTLTPNKAKEVAQLMLKLLSERAGRSAQVEGDRKRTSRKEVAPNR